MNEPIYKGLLQSDLDCAGFNLLHFAGAPAANGIPAGGTAGQSLTKIDGTDYNAHWSTITGGSTALPGQVHDVTATELLNSIAGTRTPIASLAPSTGNFFDSQSYDPCIIVNPTDSTQLIMLFSGMAAPVQTGQSTIGRATASIYDPTTWTVSNSGSPVLSASLSYETGGIGIRADSLIYNPDDSKLYLFYTAKESAASATEALASSTDLGLTWTKLGQVLTPSGGEDTCSGLSVFREGTTLHGIYSYRVSSIITHYRYATASTSNWLSWTKGGVDIYSDSSRWMEFHQLFKIGSTYLLVYESGSDVLDWDIRFATSTSPSSTFTTSPNTPFFVKSGLAGTFDRYVVATPHVMVINGYYYLIYCGANEHSIPFGTNHYQMAITPLLTSSQVSSLYIGTDARFVSITGGTKLQVRNPATNTWVDGDSWTNP